MEVVMNKYSLLLTLSMLFQTSFMLAQSLWLEEDFDFSGNLSANGWSVSSGAGTNPISTTSGLTYSDYPSSGIGNAALVDADGEDVYKTFSSQTSGNVYASFLINVNSSGSVYFLYFSNSSGNTFRGRLFILNDDTGEFEIGLSQSSASEQGITDNNYTFNTTYLLILKYSFIDGTSNDEVGLYVVESGVPNSEPSSLTLGPFIGLDVSEIGALGLRQASGYPTVIVDGIRISDAWSQAPLPVELTSFSASITAAGVKLNWRTETEVNNYGFEIERNRSEAMNQESKWQKIGFVEGYGNSNSIKEYQYVDKNISAGNYSYRLKQIDNNGAFTFSNMINVKIDVPLNYELSQNYPNPFNPTTTIKFTIQNEGYVRLNIFNILGEKVKTLLNEIKTAGTYTINFDANGMSGGIYFYKLDVNNFSRVMKMSLVK
jgi:hypothetical protein